MKKYGGILRACRERSGLTQEQLAFELKMTQSDVSKFENNMKEPTISTVQTWLSTTQAQEVLVAFLCGMDGLNIMQQIIDGAGSILGAILLGGLV